MEAHPSPTLRQIADECGVSVATVSLALRNHPRFPLETCRRIQETATRMGYRPNPFVAALMTHVRINQPARFQATLAFVNAFKEHHHELISPVFRSYYEGAVRRAKELGYQLEEFWTRERGMTAKRLTNILYSRGVSGIIVAPLPAGRGHLSLNWSNFSAAAIGYSMWRPQLHRVCHHHVHGLTLALRNLHRLGYRKIGLVMPSNFNERVDQNWLACFLLYQYGIAEELRIPPLLEQGFGLAGLPAWYRRYKPEAVISPHSVALELLLKMGLRIPEQIGFVHLDWSAANESWTGIDQKPEELGATAVDLVVSELQHNRRGIPAESKLVFLEGRWVEGSTVCARSKRVAARSTGRAKAAQAVG